MRNTRCLFAVLLGMSLPLAAAASDTLVRFKGGIGVIPFSSAANGVNAVRGVSPGGQPWVIDELSARVKVDGRIKVKGKGLLLAGGNNIGFNGGQSVKATLFCGTEEHTTLGTVPLQANGDFEIDDMLPNVPGTCASPVLLIRSAGGAWFAAGIPKLNDDD